MSVPMRYSMLCSIFFLSNFYRDILLQTIHNIWQNRLLRFLLEEPTISYIVLKHFELSCDFDFVQNWWILGRPQLCLGKHVYDQTFYVCSWTLERISTSLFRCSVSFFVKDSARKLFSINLILQVSQVPGTRRNSLHHLWHPQILRF